jgi:hypothetical protein
MIIVIVAAAAVAAAAAVDREVRRTSVSTDNTYRATSTVRVR